MNAKGDAMIAGCLVLLSMPLGMKRSPATISRYWFLVVISSFSVKQPSLALSITKRYSTSLSPIRNLVTRKHDPYTAPAQGLGQAGGVVHAAKARV